jgi:hypothetical protein
VSELDINLWSYIVKHRIPNRVGNFEENTDEVAASTQFEEIDNRQSSKSAPLSSLSRTRDKSEELAVEAER